MESEPHIMVEKEIPWEEFVEILASAYAVHIGWHIYRSDRITFHSKDFGERGILPEDAIRFFFWNGMSHFGFSKEDQNEFIKYGFGEYWIHQREYDQIEDGEDDEGTIQYRDGSTYKLKLVPLTLLQVQYLTENDGHTIKQENENCS